MFRDLMALTEIVGISHGFGRFVFLVILLQMHCFDFPQFHGIVPSTGLHITSTEFENHF